MANKSIDPIQSLFSGKSNAYAVLSLLKNKNYKECKRYIRKAISHPLTKKIIFSSALPTNYQDIRNFKGLGYSENIEGELAWITFSIIENADKINLFTKYESQIENNILNSKFSDAKNIMTRLNHEVCYSYWGLEMEYFLIEILEGTEANWSFSSDISGVLKNKLSLVFNQLFSKKVESGLMTKEYVRYLNNLLKNLTEDDFEYFGFKFSKHQYKKFKSFPFLLYAESHSSIIDRYLILINVFQEILSSNLSEYNELIGTITRELLLKIHDDRLLRILEIVDNNYYIKQPIKNDIIQIIEEYSLGNYASCLKKCINVFPDNLNSIELWDVYIKSMIEESKEFIPTGYSEFLDLQLSYLYNIYTLTDIYEDGLQNLRKNLISIPNLKFAKQLTALVNSILDKDSVDKYFNINYYLNSKISNPVIFSFKNELKSNIEFNDLISSHINSYINNVLQDLPLEIPKLKKSIYQLRREYNKGDYEEYLQKFSSIDIDNLKVSVIKEELIFKAYNSNVNISNVNTAISLYIDAYFDNINLVKRIDTQPIIKKIVDSNYNIEAGIDPVIFFTVEDLEPYHLFVMLEMYLDSKSLLYPSEIELNPEDSDYEKLVFILAQTCTEEVLDKFYMLFDYKEEVREERKKILVKLIQIEDHNNYEYIKELSTINQQEKIEEIVTKVNNSRITIKKEMLTEGDSTFEGTYARFIKLFKFSNENNINQYDIAKLLNDFLSNDNFDSATFDPAYLSFKTLVNDIIGNFLFNKFSGLDGELSTRIRHGELENQLLNIFDKKYLLSKIGDDSNYTDIEYWNSIYRGLRQETLKDLQDAIKAFSMEVDEIVQFLLKEQMQVYSENYPEKSNGFFKYRFSDQFLKLLYEEANVVTKSYEQFITYIHEILNAQTENILNIIQNFLNEALLKRFEKLTEDLLSKLSTIEQSSGIQVWQLTKNVIDIKTDIQNELMNITDWFKLNKDVLDDTMEINTLISTSFEMSNLRNSLYPISPIFNTESNNGIFIRGFNDFIFIFLNIIDNIRKHCRLKSEELVVQVDANITETHITIKINNNFSGEINKVELDQKLQIIKENWDLELDDDKLKSEGGTGFEKIKRILRHNMKAPSEFNYKIIDNTLDIIFTIQLLIFYETKDIVH